MTISNPKFSIGERVYHVTKDEEAIELIKQLKTK